MYKEESKLSKVELWDLNSQSTMVMSLLCCTTFETKLKILLRSFRVEPEQVDGDSRKIGPFPSSPPGALGGAAAASKAQESYAILMLEIHGNAAAAAPHGRSRGRNLNMKTFLWITTASSGLG